MRAKKNGKIHKWVLSFLISSGRNPNLAEILDKNSQFHFGPVDYPINKLKNIIGPSNSYKYFEKRSFFDARVNSMISDMHNGWKPAPLIATNLWEDYFEIADGGHRYAALKALGFEIYPTIFYFRDQLSLNNFVKDFTASN
jgi:hypothetical protein